MTTKYLFTIFLIMSFCGLKVYARNINEAEDPINNSYIVNQLEMDSDSDPYNNQGESSEGEILFDNSFDDRLNEKKISAGNGKSAAALQELRIKDSRYHVVEYIVKKKDNLWKISKRFKTDIAVITKLNNLSTDSILKENDAILIPVKSGIKYKIRKGDTLNSISKKYSVDIEKIAEHNNINGANIIAGKTIFIPDAIEQKPDKPVIISKTKNIKKHYANDDDFIEQKENNSKLVLAWPLKGPITSGFGYRTHPFSGRKRFHCGLDIGAEIGTPVRAASDGIVIFSDWKGAYGNLIVVQHKKNYITVYAHNSKNLVSIDEKIKKGQKIALSGMTGAVTGAHLHFEIRKGIVPLNPSRILK